MSDQNTIIIITVISGFVVVLLSLIMAASLLRQVRFLKHEQTQFMILSPSKSAAFAPVDEWVLLRNVVPLPELVSMPICNTASDAGILKIEPGERSSRKQQNFDKLFSFLKQETLHPEIAPKAS